MYTVEALENEVELVQAELQDILTQKALLESDHANVEQIIQNDLEIAKAKRKADEISRAQLKSESKLLEETKHQLDTQRAKLERANKLVTAELDRKTSEKNKWLREIESAKLKISKHDKAIEEIHYKADEQLSKAQEELNKLQSTTSELDDEIKGLASSTKRTDSLKSASLQALVKAKGKTDKVTGIINDSYVAKLLESPDVHSKLKDALKSELDYENQLENDWKRTQKDLETRYLKVHVMYSEAQKTYDKSVEMHNKNANGNDTNPVYEAVAAAAAAAAGHPNSTGGELQGHPMSPTVSNMSAGKKRRNRSRRNTKSQTSASFIGSPQQAFMPVTSNNAIAGNSPSTSMYVQPVSLSPPNIPGHHTNAMIDSPDPVFTSLTTSKSAVSASQSSSYWDLPQSIPTSRPSEFQTLSVFLPSYLLKDEGAETQGSILDANSIPGATFDTHLLDRLFSSERPSGSILGQALHAREGSGESFRSAVGSVNSSPIDSSPQGEVNFSHSHISPQNSFNQLFPQNGAPFGGPSNISSISQASVPNPDGQNTSFASEGTVKAPSSKGKFGSMFLFGKPRNQTRSTSGEHPTPQDHSGGHSLFFKKNPHRMENHVDDGGLKPTSLSNSNEVSTLGLRRRSGSLNSIGSLPASLGESFNGNGMLNLWGDVSRPSGLEPSRSHISTTLSIDRNPNSKVFGPPSLLGNNRHGFESQPSGLGWHSFATPNRSSPFMSAASSIKDDNQLEATWNHMPNNTIAHPEAKDETLEPHISIADVSNTDTTPQPNKRRFSKGFASFFSSSTPSAPSNDSMRSASSAGPPKSVEETHEQTSLVNSVSDGAISIDTDTSKDSTPIASVPPRETILQKGIRTFSLPRKVSTNGVPSSTSSTPKSKFTMRRLSMFGKKDITKDPDDQEAMKQTEKRQSTDFPEMQVLPENHGNMDFQNFLSQAEKQQD